MTGSKSAWFEQRPLQVLGMGHALPGAPVSTGALIDHVVQQFGLPIGNLASAIARRLGIETRHLCRPLNDAVETPRSGERNADLAAAAVRAALDQAHARISDVRYLIGHTATPGRALPANISEVASLLDYEGPFCEFRQACTGFANALLFAHGLITSGGGLVVIVGSETGSVFFDPRRTPHDSGQLVNMLQMGDAAAAVVLADDHSHHEAARISKIFHGQSGRGRKAGLSMTDGGSNSPATSRDVSEFAHDFAAIRLHGPHLFERCAEAAAKAGIVDADRVLPHQANGRMAEVLAPILGIDPGRVVVNADRVGNTGSAAIWLALSQLRPALGAGERVMVLGAEATDYMYGGFLYVHD